MSNILIKSSSSFFRKKFFDDKTTKIFNLDLIANTYNSYNDLFLKNSKIVKNNLDNIFKKKFPITVCNNGLLINYIDFNLSSPFMDYIYCIKNGLTYEVNLRVKFCLSLPQDCKNFFNCQYLNIANIPLINNKGTFVINGIEKFIVSKFTRAPGIYFMSKIVRNKNYVTIKIIPNQGPDFYFNLNGDNLLSIKVSGEEISIIYLLKYMGLSNKNIVDKFYNSQVIFVINNEFNLKFNYKYFFNITIPYDIFDKSGNVIVSKNTIINEDLLNKIKNCGIEYIKISSDYLIGKFLSIDINTEDNSIIGKIGDKIDQSLLKKIKLFAVKEFSVIYFSTQSHFSVINSIMQKNIDSESIKTIVENLFMKLGFLFINKKFLKLRNFDNIKFFDISDIRSKINYKLNKKGFSGPNYFIIDDFLKIIKFLILLKDGLCLNDDMQSLNSMSLNLVGDMLYDIFKKNISNLMIKYQKSKINFKDRNLFPKDFLSFLNLNNEIKKFFNVSRYSQFLDQTNALSELSHKRRVSFFGIPGVSAKHSGFNVRDLNPSYYSKLCPVETPEGINIGLIGSLSLFAIVNKNKELMSPYFKVVNRKILNKMFHYLTNWQESNSLFCDTNIKLLPNNYIKSGLIYSRCNDQLIITKSDLINYIDIFSFQILSVCTSLIPFIEYNDSNRGLMAANMLKQALPCLFPQRPIIGTGLEYYIGTNDNSILKSKDYGVVKYIDSSNLIIEKNYKKDDLNFFDYDIYTLEENRSSNQNTYMRNKFIVKLHDVISPNQILNDNYCTDNGELALGQNMVVAFMPWGGYNFEDSIIVSDKVVNDDRFTTFQSIIMDINLYSNNDCFDILSKDVILNESLNNNLDNFGIIKAGTLVSSGDLLIGKKTKYFKKKKYKIISIKDSSVFLPNNFTLSVIEKVEIYFSKNFPISKSDKLLINNQVKRFLKNKKILFMSSMKIIKEKIISFFINKEVISFDGKIIIYNKSDLCKMKLIDLLNLSFKDNEINLFYKKIALKFKKYILDYKFECKNVRERFIKVLPIDVSKMIKIYFIKKKRLQVGDKMSGRHGNKGVISKIVPMKDMPQMENGTAIDILLNPLGVPSRMNVGQLLEVHLGLVSLLVNLHLKRLLSLKKFNAIKDFLVNIYNILNDDISLEIKNYNRKELVKISKYLINGFYFGVPGFSSFKEDNINELLNFITSKVKGVDFINSNKQMYLYDGRSGKRFDNPVTVGIMYILKLNHLAEDKTHARSVGPYSLVTQQPLKGKASMGGQRLGEMEIWALEAYGASYTLRDMLTIKSDDIYGRLDAYKNIVNGSSNFKYNRPESFDVMLNNINSLGIHSRFID